MKMQILLLAILIGAQASAQTNAIVIDDASAAMPKKKRVVQYDEASNSVVEIESQPVMEARQPIYILNHQRQQAVQEQPPTLVEASPLAESRAEQMRKKRQGLEVHTEQKIVEKLEEARMEDEKSRAERLFGNGFGSGRNEAPVAVPLPEPVPVVVAPPPPVQAVAPVMERDEEKVDVRSEIKAAMAELHQKEEPQDRVSYFVGGVVGLSEYPDASNVKGNVATGVTVGVVTTDRIVVEGSFLYSDYEAQDFTQLNPYKDLSQYNFGAAVKYQLLPGKLRPFAGGVVGYTYRKSTDRRFGGGYYGHPQGTAEGTSNAFDLGLAAGLDLQLTETFAIGGEFRYMTNVSYRRNDNLPAQFGYGGAGLATPIEEMDYYTITLGGKFTF